MAVPAILAAAGTVAAGAMTVGAHVGVLAPLTRAAGYLVNQQCPNELPPAPLAIAAWRAGYLEAADVQYVCNSYGIMPPDGVPQPEYSDIGIGVSQRYKNIWKQCHELSVQVLSPNEILVAWNRDLISQQTAVSWMKHQGIVWPSVISALSALRFEIPGASDLVQFALKEAWDPQVVQRFGYDNEFPVEFQYWMDRQGFGSDARTPAQIQQGAPPVSWPQLYWRTHWQTIAPGQAYEMFQRLRPERIRHWQTMFPGVQPFTLSDVEQVLKIADYPSAFRLQLTAMSYKLPRIRDVQAWYEFGIIDEEEVEQIAKDYGYTPQNAIRRRQQVVAIARDKLEKKLRINPLRGIYNGYKQGILTRGEAARMIYQNAQFSTVGDPAWSLMDRTNQMAYALENPDVKATLDQLDLDFNTKRTAKFLADVKRTYQRGMQTWEQVNIIMDEYGINELTRTYLHVDWDRELFAGKMLASTAMIRRWVLKQIIPMPVAQQWLTNLGWREPERGAIVAELLRDVQLELAKAQERVARTAEQRRKALEQQVKAANSARAKAIQKLLNTLSPAKAVRYFVHGVFSTDDLTRALQLHDYRDAALVAAVNDAKVQRKDYLDSRKKPATAPSTNGSAKPPAPKA